MNRRSLPEDDELVHLKRKAELAKRIEELEKTKEEGLGPNTIGLINKVRTLLIIFIVSKIGWHIFKSASKFIDARNNRERTT
jgi:hypothetical protein